MISVHSPATCRRILPFSPIKNGFKYLAFGIARVIVLPYLAIYHFVAWIVGPDRALESASQWLALLPGHAGTYLRRAFLASVLVKCDRTAEIHFGVLFSQCGAIIEENVYVGPRCHLGRVHIERNVLIAAGVHIPSGARTHYFDDITVPVKDQGGERQTVRIGRDAWIGSGAIILADVGRGTVVGAGSVVTRPLPDMVIAVGNPARVLRSRIGDEDRTELSEAT